MVGRILKEDVEKVRSAADLYDIVSDSVTLKSSGSGTFMGLCPFHDEKTPSFSVRPSIGAWHCFGCGLGGDVFGYVEQSESVGFAEAVEILADKYGIELHYENTPQSQQRTGSTRSRLLQANEEAQKFFVGQLMTKEALPARKLLGGRTFTKSQSARFGCGYAPQGWDNLVRHLAGLGFTQQEMVDAGLARMGQHGVYDYFRGRATWPIRDSTGRTIGFGARKLYDDDQIAAKYINTPDTTLYHKNQVLYGIDLAKKAIVSKRQVVIVEGYTDVMACHLAGIDTAVATCGTAFGLEHAKIVRRLISDDSLGAVQLIGPVRGSRVVFTFDGDAAGQKAAIHAFGLDGTFLTQTFVAVAQDGLDPCDLRIEHGDVAVQKLIESAKPLYDFVIDTAISAFDTQYTTGRVGAMKAVAPVIAQIRDRSLVGEYARKAARTIGVDLAQMNTEVESARRRLGVRDEDAYAPRRRGQSFAAQLERNEEMTPGARSRQRLVTQRRGAAQQGYFRVDDAVFICEQQLMGAVIQIPSAVDHELFSKLDEMSFVVPVFTSLYQAIIVAGGLPDASVPAGQWLHTLTKAAGPMLEPVINELAVLPLPLPGEDSSGAGGSGSGSGSGSGVGSGSGSGSGFNRGAGQSQTSGDTGSVAVSDAAIQYVTELMAKLRDGSLMRRVDAIHHQMNSASDPNVKIQLLETITKLEAERKRIRAQIFEASHR
jgi:DNA primase